MLVTSLAFFTLLYFRSAAFIGAVTPATIHLFILLNIFKDFGVEFLGHGEGLWSFSSVSEGMVKRRLQEIGFLGIALAGVVRSHARS